MRRFFATLAVLGLAAGASAQTLDPSALNLDYNNDGSYESSWKVNGPTTAGDFFNQDYDATRNGSQVVGVATITNVTGPVGQGDGRLGIYNDSATFGGSTPDLSSPVGGAEMVNPTGGNKATGGCTAGTQSEKVFDTADVTLGATSVHVAYTQVAGDSNLWMCADTNSGTFLGGFTTNSYATSAIPFTANWALGFAGNLPCDTVLVNGSGSATVAELGAVSLTFQACCPARAFVLFCFNVGPITVYLPFALPTDASGFLQLSGTIPCLGISGSLTLNVSAIYTDPCDTKPNGNDKIKISGSAQLTITENSIGCGGGKVCFGLQDDTILDSTIWKVQNPAGSQDYFNVRYDTNGEDGVSCTATGLEVASWDFCGSSQTWASVGAYGANLALDSSGGTPDIFGGVIAEVAGGAMGANQADWTYPATFYDTPDVHIGSGVVQPVHGAVQWNTGDTCVWIGSDTDGIDDDGGTDCAGLGAPVTSYFTLDQYTNPAVPFSTANWMIKLNWK